MGIPVGIEVRAPVALPRDVLDAAFAVLREADARFSTWRQGSEIRRLDAGTLALQDAHPDVRAVLQRCEALRVRTGGAFDVRARGALDPSGYVKGWAVERAAEVLRAAGATSFCLHAGGDVLTAGGPWRVGIAHPRRRDALAAVLEVADLAVATSGSTERGDHVVDPRTGRAPSAVLSVTVVGPGLAEADALATAAFALDADGPAFTATLEGHEALTILAEGRMLSTPGLAALRRD